MSTKRVGVRHQLNIFFDVDYTILSVSYTLRPGTYEVFEKLVADGHLIYIWSGVGLRWDEIRDHNLDAFVTDVFHKPTTDYVAGLEEMGFTDPGLRGRRLSRHCGRVRWVLRQ